MKVLIVGKGFIADHLRFDRIKQRISISDKEVQNILDTEKPDVIINTIGYCGEPNIDACEVNKSKTYTANVVIPLILAQVCEKKDIRMIHLGSGCIYYGISPAEKKWADGWMIPPEGVGWCEEDAATPLSFYSKTKYATDMMIGGMKNVTTLRLRMPISHLHSPRNLIDKLKRYKEVIDEPNSVTFLSDLTRAVDFVIEKNLTGIYHITSKQPLTATQVMIEYQRYHPEHTFQIIDLKRLSELTTAPRSNCILDSSKIEREGFVFEGSLESTMKEYCS